MPVLDHVCWARYSKIYDQIQAYLLSFFVALAALFCRQGAVVNVVCAVPAVANYSSTGTS